MDAINLRDKSLPELVGMPIFDELHPDWAIVDKLVLFYSKLFPKSEGKTYTHKEVVFKVCIMAFVECILIGQIVSSL